MTVSTRLHALAIAQFPRQHDIGQPRRAYGDRFAASRAASRSLPGAYRARPTYPHSSATRARRNRSGQRAFRGRCQTDRAVASRAPPPSREICRKRRRTFASAAAAHRRPAITIEPGEALGPGTRDAAIMLDDRGALFVGLAPRLASAASPIGTFGTNDIAWPWDGMEVFSPNGTFGTDGKRVSDHLRR